MTSTKLSMKDVCFINFWVIKITLKELHVHTLVRKVCVKTITVYVDTCTLLTVLKLG